MASVTLAESAKLAQDELAAGLIESVITVNQFFEILPFDSFDGNSLQYNRENALAAAAPAGVGTNLRQAKYKDPATFTSVNVGLTKIIGDAEIDNLIQATRSGDGNDQAGLQVASKAKTIGRSYQQQLITGTGTNDEFLGLEALCATNQKIAPAANGQEFSFEILDELADLVTDKDGQVDYYMLNKRERRAYRSKLRAQGGATIMETIELPSGATVMSYSQVGVFRNDYIPTDQTQGTATNASTIWAGTLDDGSRTTGIAGLTARNAAGMSVTPLGEREDADEFAYRVKWYCSMALFSEKGLAAAPGIVPAP